MNLPNKLTIFRMILVPIMVIIPIIGMQGEILGIPITYILIDIIFGFNVKILRIYFIKIFFFIIKNGIILQVMVIL